MANTESLCTWPRAALSDERALSGPWAWRRAASSRAADGEPSLAELLADPIARAVMRADGVAAEDVVALFDRLRAAVSFADK